MNIEYCCEKCEKGREAVNKATWKYESAFDAFFEINQFIKECFETCPYKQFHKEEEESSDDKLCKV